jgi:hypothetical protein
MVVNFFWGSANTLMNELHVTIRTSRHNADFLASIGAAGWPEALDDPKSTEATAQAVESIKTCCDLAEKLFSGLKCAHIDRAIESLRHTPTEPHLNWGELNTRARALRDAIETELRGYLYYQYPRQMGQKLAAWRDDWKRSLAAFPAIEYDVFSATDCYALGHNTASVFHSMRVAEHGLRGLARERQITLPKDKQIEWATWQEIIKALDDEIKKIGVTMKAGSAKDAALSFYSGARADLNGFKDEYRNLVSHLRASYDEFQALRALNYVNAFMQRISEKIDRNHHRIKWDSE